MIQFMCKFSIKVGAIVPKSQATYCSSWLEMVFAKVSNGKRNLGNFWGIVCVLFLDLSDGYMLEFGKSKNYEGMRLSPTNVSIM